MIFNKLVRKYDQINLIIKEERKSIPDDKSVCTEMLGIIGNNDVNIDINSSYKGSFYNVITNTITLSDNIEGNDRIERLVVTAHECIHSIQNKKLLYMNFILSNITFILFAFDVIGGIFKWYKVDIYSLLMYIFVSCMTLTIRLYLEVDATKRSVELSEKYLLRNLDIIKVKDIIYIIREQINNMLPIFILSLSVGHVIRIILLIIILIMT